MPDQSTFKNMVSRILRGIVLIAIACAGLGVATVIVLWDADLYTARDKFEHFRLAILGDWQPENWCPRGRISDNCTAIDDFVTRFDQARDITFFRTEPVNGTELTVFTGVRFQTARDVVDSRPTHQWCYLEIPNDQTSQRIDLVTKAAGSAPNYHDFSGLNDLDAAGSGMAREQLSLLAQTHCRFNSPNLTN